MKKEILILGDRTNVNGGAIARPYVGRIRNAIGLTLLLELKRRGQKYGLATACIGAGQGIAMVVEAF